MMGAHGVAPIGGLLPAGSGNDRQAKIAGCQLNGDGADAPGPANDQQGLALTLARAEAQLVFQSLPGGQRRQWQGCGFLHAKAVRFAADQSLVHTLVLGIAALPLRAAGIPDPVACLEVFHLATHRLDDAGCIKTQYPVTGLFQRPLP